MADPMGDPMAAAEALARFANGHRGDSFKIAKMFELTAGGFGTWVLDYLDAVRLQLEDGGPIEEPDRSVLAKALIRWIEANKGNYQTDADAERRFQALAEWAEEIANGQN